MEWLSTLSNFSKCAVLPGSLPTCGVQFMSRGRGRSAEQSGASAGCCRCKNRIIRLHHFKQILTTTFTATTLWRYTFNANILRPCSFTTIFFTPRASVSRRDSDNDLQKVVFQIPSSLLQHPASFASFPSRSVSLHCVPGDAF